jgi:hypothetical protein
MQTISGDAGKGRVAKKEMRAKFSRKSFRQVCVLNVSCEHFSLPHILKVLPEGGRKAIFKRDGVSDTQAHLNSPSNHPFSSRGLCKTSNFLTFYTRTHAPKTTLVTYVWLFCVIHVQIISI